MTVRPPGADRLHRLGAWFHRRMPTREGLERSRWLRPVAHRVLRPELWRFTRRSVPRGVALGLVVGIFLMLPFVQVAGAILLALPFRANVPVAAGMTFLSNPATTPLILAVALGLGNRLLGSDATIGSLMALFHSHAGPAAYWAWAMSEAAPAMILGLAIIATASGVVGYAASALGWRLWIARKWRARAHHLAIVPR